MTNPHDFVDYDDGVINDAGVYTRRDALRLGAVGALGLGGLLAGGDAAALAARLAPAAAKPKRGGTIVAGLLGGDGADESLDPHMPTTSSLPLMRNQNVFSKLTDMAPDGGIVMQLADEIDANKTATVWTVRIKTGVTFHNGASLTADDVIWSLHRILDPANKLSTAAASLNMIDPQSIKKLDAHTVRMSLLKPWSDMPAQFAQRYSSIIRRGTTQFTPANVIGTGPFRFASWTPGVGTSLKRNPHYFEDHKPYVDGVQASAINDPTARFNALQSGQVNAVEWLDPSTVASMRSSGLRPIISPAGSWTPLNMHAGMPPFNDVRVRRAFKLLANRPQMVQVALQGYGRVGNDIFGIGDPLYDSRIAQHQFDPEQAASLLRQAGVLDQTFTIHTSDYTAPMQPAALLFQQAAKQAGVNVSIQVHPAAEYWDATLGKVPLMFDDWSYRPFLAQWVRSFWEQTETGWRNAKADRYVTEAAGTVDEKRRRELAGAAQQILWDEGPYVLWGFNRTISGTSGKLVGIKPHIFYGLGWYGFKDGWFT